MEKGNNINVGIILSVIITGIMVCMSELTQETEIIFPEIVALCIGVLAGSHKIYFK